MDKTQRLYGHRLLRTLVDDTWRFLDRRDGSARASAVDDYITRTRHLTYDLVSAARRAHAGLALQAYRPYVHRYEDVGLDQEELWLYHEAVLITQVVSIFDIALRLTNCVLRLGLRRKELRLKDVISESRLAPDAPLVKHLRRLFDAVEPYRAIRNSHIHEGATVPFPSLEAFYYQTSTQFLSGDDRCVKHDWTRWSILQEARLDPIVTSTVALMDDLLQVYQRERELDSIGRNGHNVLNPACLPRGLLPCRQRKP